VLIFTFIYQPILKRSKRIWRNFVYANDVTEQVNAREIYRAEEKI
jgi:hypothetical protein